jgi:V/A-type H+/Na+-transporting ATPase subunit C
VSDYDYLNARVRGMSTLLLGREFYERVLQASTEAALADALLATPYAEDMQRATAAHAGAVDTQAVETALSTNVRTAFSKILAMAPPDPRRLIALQVNRWDVANVMALLRGKLAGAGPRELLAAVLPIGEMTEVQLGELSAEIDVVNLADALPTWKHAFAFVLRHAIRECADKDDMTALESALYRGWFQWALSQLAAGDPRHDPARESLRRQIDLVNVQAALERIRDRARGGARENVEPIPGGKLPWGLLAELAACDTLVTAFEMLGGTYFAPGIGRGILAYGQAQSLAVMERFLESVVVEHGCRLFRQDVLSAAVPLGYIWRKYSELVNLRLLVRGIRYGMPANAIREGMILV